jgi:hypothetical protein
MICQALPTTLSRPAQPPRKARQKRSAAIYGGPQVTDSYNQKVLPGTFRRAGETIASYR